MQFTVLNCIFLYHNVPATLVLARKVLLRKIWVVWGLGLLYSSITRMEGYKHLSTYILATVIHDLTVEFVKKWVRVTSRTVDQMEQAARSGKQNIAEGYTMQSLESYIKLCGVAEGSIKELAADFEDFLRQNKLAIWEKEDPRVRVFRAFRAVREVRDD